MQWGGVHNKLRWVENLVVKNQKLHENESLR